ncbi:replicative DNA helicase [Candidatus Bartonella washoeensis]|nr:replicative DNA helicase [Bartonella washoeensis]
MEKVNFVECWETENQRGDLPASFRQLSHNIEAEQALLGAILINNDDSIVFQTFSKQSIFLKLYIKRSLRLSYKLFKRVILQTQLHLSPISKWKKKLEILLYTSMLFA